MKKSIVLFAAASAFALLSAPAFADKGGAKPDKDHGADNADGRGHKDKKSDHGRDDHDNNSECGLGRRDHGDDPAGARDPELERGGDCPANDDHGDRDDDRRDHDDYEDNDADDHGDHREHADRDRSDDHQGDGADDNADDADDAGDGKKKSGWRWPWERDN